MQSGAYKPRWVGMVDIGEAHAAVADVLDVWRGVAQWRDAQPFSGGVWDAWPHRLAQGVAFLRGESAVVSEYLMDVARKKEAKRG